MKKKHSALGKDTKRLLENLAQELRQSYVQPSEQIFADDDNLDDAFINDLYEETRTETKRNAMGVKTVRCLKNFIDELKEKQEHSSTRLQSIKAHPETKRGKTRKFSKLFQQKLSEEI